MMSTMVTATVATVFLVPKGVSVLEEDLVNHYDYLYQDSRPADPVITDRWFFIYEGKEDSSLLQSIKDLTKVNDLRAVNFIVLDDEDDNLTKESHVYFKSMLKEFENHFKINSYTGGLVLGIVVQCFTGMLFDKYRVHGLNRYILGL